MTLTVIIGELLLAACASKPVATIGGTEQRTADEAAIRSTIAGLEQRINRGDAGFVDVFSKDAVIIVPGAPDIVGFDAIRDLYTGMMKQDSMTVHFSTEEVAVAGNLAYERGTYTLTVTDKATGRVVQDVHNKHLHILKRQPDRTWKTWRMMVSSAQPAQGQN